MVRFGRRGAAAACAGALLAGGTVAWVAVEAGADDAPAVVLRAGTAEGTVATSQEPPDDAGRGPGPQEPTPSRTPTPTPSPHLTPVPQPRLPTPIPQVDCDEVAANLAAADLPPAPQVATGGDLAPEISISEPRNGLIVYDQELEVSFNWGLVGDLGRLDLVVDGTTVASTESDSADLVWYPWCASEGIHTLTGALTDSDGRVALSDPVIVLVEHRSDPMLLLETDLQGGVLTREDYTRYAIYRYFEPSRVPEQYRLPEEVSVEGELTVEMLDAMRFWDEIDPAVRQELEEYLSPGTYPGPSREPLTPEQIEEALAPFEHG